MEILIKHYTTPGNPGSESNGSRNLFDPNVFANFEWSENSKIKLSENAELWATLMALHNFTAADLKAKFDLCFNLGAKTYSMPKKFVLEIYAEPKSSDSKNSSSLKILTLPYWIEDGLNEEIFQNHVNRDKSRGTEDFWSNFFTKALFGSKMTLESEIQEKEGELEDLRTKSEALESLGQAKLALN